MVTVIQKPEELVAHRHDGSQQSALHIRQWLMDNDADYADTVIDNSRASWNVDFFMPNVVGRQILFPNWWVVKLGRGRILSMSEREFDKRFAVYSSKENI